MDGKEQVYAWPDAFWCNKEELESMLLSGRSDDYCVVWIPEEFMHLDWAIDAAVEGAIHHEK